MTDDRTPESLGMVQVGWVHECKRRQGMSEDTFNLTSEVQRLRRDDPVAFYGGLILVVVLMVGIISAPTATCSIQSTSNSTTTTTGENQ